MRGKKVLIIHYGDLLKYICKSLFGWDGQKDDRGRTLLQYVGTERVRALYPDYWVQFVRDMLNIFDREWDYVLIPDVRFPNEIKGMAEFNPYIIRIVRPGFNMLTEKQRKHPSETALDGFDAPFLTVMNNGSLEHLEVLADEVSCLICDE